MLLVIDHSSIELFADDGTTVMSATFFPGEVFKKITLEGKGTVQNIAVSTLKSSLQ
jgi:sucrose-6-phosphate hydrolase SacC (GH32 family)